MELNVSKFVDMDENEVYEFDGGGMIMTIYWAARVDIAVVKFVYNDLKNCYNNGYNEVISAH